MTTPASDGHGGKPLSGEDFLTENLLKQLATPARTVAYQPSKIGRRRSARLSKYPVEMIPDTLEDARRNQGAWAVLNADYGSQDAQ
jgi:hypothetical protein